MPLIHECLSDTWIQQIDTDAAAVFKRLSKSRFRPARSALITGLLCKWKLKNPASKLKQKSDRFICGFQCLVSTHVILQLEHTRQTLRSRLVKRIASLRLWMCHLQEKCDKTKSKYHGSRTRDLLKQLLHSGVSN